MRVVIVNAVWDRRANTPDATLDRFHTLTGWADAVRAAGASVVTVCQRFDRDATLVRQDVTYVFRADGGAAAPSTLTRRSRPLEDAVLAAAPDLVHVNGFEHPAILAGLRAALPHATALVVQDHGGIDLEHLSFPRRRWLRHGLRCADALLVSSAGQIAIARRARLVPSTVRIVDVMESSTTMAPVARPRRDDAFSPAILWVGRLNANKDPLTVLRGVGAFMTRHPDARLTMIYGAADLERAVRAEIAASPVLARGVRLIGEVDHARLASYYTDADLFVLGSRREGSGYAAIEALACGVVPVLTDIPPFRALTADGTVGALWTHGDPASLDAALERTMTGGVDTQRAAARALFQSTFTWTAIGARAMNIYRTVLTARH
jgi:glycosyltransferase involved in cell wall biosynthesis